MTGEELSIPNKYKNWEKEL